MTASAPEIIDAPREPGLPGWTLLVALAGKFLAYALIVVPVGLLLRLARRDPLGLKPGKTESYWRMPRGRQSDKRR